MTLNIPSRQFASFSNGWDPSDGLVNKLGKGNSSEGVKETDPELIPVVSIELSVLEATEISIDESVGFVT